MDKVTSREIRELFDRQGGRCGLTGVIFDVQNLSLDHIVPLKDGGDHAIENCELVTRKINAMKGGLSRDEFVRLCCSVADYSRSGSYPAPSNGETPHQFKSAPTLFDQK